MRALIARLVSAEIRTLQNKTAHLEAELAANRKLLESANPKLARSLKESTELWCKTYTEKSSGNREKAAWTRAKAIYFSGAIGLLFTALTTAERMSNNQTEELADENTRLTQKITELSTSGIASHGEKVAAFAENARLKDENRILRAENDVMKAKLSGIISRMMFGSTASYLSKTRLDVADELTEEKRESSTKRVTPGA